MTDAAHAASGPGAMRRVRTWDIVVRAFHWSLVALVLFEAFLSDPESHLHLLAGYAVVGLLALRLVWGLVGTRFARFSAFPPSLGGALGHLASLMTGRREEPHLSHNPLGALMVYNLLATLALITATGIMMGMDAFWGVDWVEETHEALVNWLLFSVVLHVAGVVFETRRTRVNLVRAMVTGWKEMPGRSA